MKLQYSTGKAFQMNHTLKCHLLSVKFPMDLENTKEIPLHLNGS